MVRNKHGANGGRTPPAKGLFKSRIIDCKEEEGEGLERRIEVRHMKRSIANTGDAVRQNKTHDGVPEERIDTPETGWNPSKHGERDGCTRPYLTVKKFGGTKKSTLETG